MTTTKRVNLKGIGFRLNVLGDYGSSLILETGWRTSFKQFYEKGRWFGRN
jgi:hypothetical protein